MIKLIASDMDGTLLDDSKRLPPDFFGVLDRLFQRDIRFAVASGRTYAAVSHLFPEEYADKLDYICDNGAYIRQGGKIIQTTPLERPVFRELISACKEIGGLKVLVCAEGGTYHLEDDPEFNAEVERFYKNHIVCGDLSEIDDTIYKIAVCDPHGTMNRAKPELDRRFRGRVSVLVSGQIWMDVMAEGVSKGSALAVLREHLGIERSDTMAFGDYYNDEDMLQNAGWSFAMANGNEHIKSIAGHIAESNNSGGVTKAILEYALGEVTV